MIATLCVLGLAAFAMVAALLSVLTRGALPWLDRLATRVPAALRARAWFALSALPTVVGAATVLAAFLPAMGIGQDHCLDHGLHVHPHLCPQHLEGSPGIVLSLLAALVGVRALGLSFGLLRGVHTSKAVGRALGQASDERDGVAVFASDDVQAFTLGAFRPRVYASRGLLAMGEAIAEGVLAHERAHVRRRDSVWRALQPLLALGHLPATAAALRARLVLAQEMAADDDAAASLPDGRLRIATALLALAQGQRPPSHGIPFAHGDVEARVRALLAPPPPRGQWPQRLLFFGAASLLAALLLSHGVVHHGLESLLGVLS